MVAVVAIFQFSSFIKKNDISNVKKDVVIKISHECSADCVLNNEDFYFMVEKDRKKLASFLAQNDYQIEKGVYTLYLGISYKEARDILKYHKLKD